MSNILLLTSLKGKAVQLAEILESEKHNVTIADHDYDLQQYVIIKPDLVYIDAVIGQNIFLEARKIFQGIPLVCLLPEYNAQLAVRFMRVGAFECLAPPVKRNDVLIVTNHFLRNYHRKPSRAFKNLIKIKRPVIYLGLLGAVLVSVFVVIMYSSSGKKTRIGLPYTNPTAIVCDGKDIWISDWYTQTIYHYLKQANDLKLFKTNYYASFGPLALAKYEDFLWSVGNDYILRKHFIKDETDISQSFQLKGGHLPSGITFVGNSLWLCDSQTKMIYQYMLGESLTLVNSFNSGLTNPVGPCWDGEYLWIADSNTNQLHLFEQKLNEIKHYKAYYLPKVNSGVLAGIAVYKGKVYIVFADSPSYLMIYKISALKSYEI